jgi:V8-like Glu-specific endopeptidase
MAQFTRNKIEARETLITVADAVINDYRSNGFATSLAMGYNILVSAAHYLKTGERMIGNRTEAFFHPPTSRTLDAIYRAVLKAEIRAMEGGQYEATISTATRNHC